MFATIIVPLVIVALLAVSTAQSFLSIRSELTGRSTYYKKKRGYVGSPSFAKTVELALATPHLRLRLYKGAFFWSLVLALIALAYAFA